MPVDPGVADFVRALDPAALSDDDFDGLLAAAGLPVGGDGLACPTGWPRSTRCSTSPRRALREALLVAFLDRLSRPTPPL